MHVGNLRSTIIGDCFVRVLRAVGHTVVPQNHIGDWGTQFGMLVEQILHERTELATLDLDGSVALYKRAQTHFKTDDEFAGAARRRVVALQAGDPETRAIWQARACPPWPATSKASSAAWKRCPGTCAAP